MNPNVRESDRTIYSDTRYTAALSRKYNSPSFFHGLCNDRCMRYERSPLSQSVLVAHEGHHFPGSSREKHFRNLSCEVPGLLFRHIRAPVLITQFSSQQGIGISQGFNSHARKLKYVNAQMANVGNKTLVSDSRSKTVN